jgi:fatty acid desaturase
MRLDLTRDEIRALTRTSNLPGALAIAWSWLVIAGCLYAVSRWWVAWPVAVIVLGGRQLALAVMMHDAAHGTLFRTRWLNEGAADWLCARPIWADTARYRKQHLGHHAHTGTERDPDLDLAPVERMSRRSLRRKILRDVTGAAGLRRVAALIAIDAGAIAIASPADEGRAAAPEAVRRSNDGGTIRRIGKPSLARLAKNIAPMLITNALLAYAAGWAYLAWVVAYLTAFSLFLRVRSLAEHACLERTDDMLRNTRTTRASWLARATVAPLHVNYHVEHHLLPTVPWYRLPALARRVAGQVPPPTAGYMDVLRAVSR